MIIPADDELCANCGKPYTEHAGHGEWCEANNEDELWSSTKKFTPASNIDRSRGINEEMLAKLQELYAYFDSIGDGAEDASYNQRMALKLAAEIRPILEKAKGLK